jgi:N-methylhydantoinase A
MSLKTWDFLVSGNSDLHQTWTRTNWFATPPDCIVPPQLRFGVPERTAPDGRILRRPAAREIEDLVARVGASGAESIAISLLFAFANPENETLVARALGRLGKPVSVSHVILPEFREYERAATVTVNAYLAPKVGTYLTRIWNTLGEKWRDSSCEVMQSSGGIVPAAFASERPVRTVLSGPAGGVIGAYLVAARAGFHKIIAFDMGGHVHRRLVDRCRRRRSGNDQRGGRLTGSGANSLVQTGTE